LGGSVKVHFVGSGVVVGGEAINEPFGLFRAGSPFDPFIGFLPLLASMADAGKFFPLFLFSCSQLFNPFRLFQGHIRRPGSTLLG
jgi:hypothetical protein